ncbi:uncharacterized protein LOC135707844 [Ochlerotatus camptorhynchus]|uniref:uncharacterized protein LOC135707844 n=1 Tax=Ochlerotatus camptorhynchus TaxID=644619 RepID=UPI0031D6DB1B
MKSTVSLCLAILLLVLSATTLEARRKNRKRDQNVHIEIYYPKGLMVWYPKQRGMVGFGVEIFLNQKYEDSEEPKCDICLNTTDVSYGKFMIHNDNAIIRAGDHLMYRAIKQKINGSAYVAKSNEFYVAESRILPQLEECSSPMPTTRSSNDQSNIAMLQDDVTLLENIVYDAFQHCNNVTQTSKNLYLNFRPVETRLNSKALFDYTLDMLKEMLPKIDWDTVLVNAFYYEDGVGFEVKTLIDKLKALQMSKNLGEHTVTDLDDLDQFVDDESNEISFHDVRSNY